MENVELRKRALPILLGFEALTVSATAVGLLVLMIVGHPSNLPAALFELFFASLVAVMLWSTVRSRRFRSAAILMNIIALPVAKTLVESERLLLALLVGVTAVLTLIALILDRKSLS